MTPTALTTTQYRTLADQVERHLAYFSTLLLNHTYRGADHADVARHTESALMYCRTLYVRTKDEEVEDLELRRWAWRAGVALAVLADCSVNARGLNEARDMLKALRMHCWYAGLESGVG